MYKTGLVRRVAQETGLSQRLVAQVLRASLQTVERTLVAGERVSLPGFGTFYTSQRQAGRVRSVRTGRQVEIPARRVAPSAWGRYSSEPSLVDANAADCSDWAANDWVGRRSVSFVRAGTRGDGLRRCIPTLAGALERTGEKLRAFLTLEARDSSRSPSRGRAKSSPDRSLAGERLVHSHSVSPSAGSFSMIPTISLVSVAISGMAPVIASVVLPQCVR